MTHPASNGDYFDQSFSKLDLSASRLEGASFEECEFNHCNFTSAQLTRCKFIHCSFNNCNLSVTEIIASRFNEVRFNECKLSGIDWTRAHWPAFNLAPALQFTGSVMTDASFFGLALHGLKMADCRLNGVDFRECDLSCAEIIHCDLAGSLFSNTDLQDADFTDSWDFQIDVLNNAVARAKFSRLEAVSLLESLGIELVD